MLGILPEKKKAAWHDMVLALMHAYNYNKGNATVFSPYYLRYGHKPYLSIDLYFGMRTFDTNTNTSTKFVQKIKKTLLGLQNGTSSS